MTILSLAGPPASPAFCDFLKLTFPAERAHEVDAVIRPAVAACRGSLAAPGLWHLVPMASSLADAEAYLKRPGTVRAQRVGQVYSVGLSGVALASLRAFGELERLVAAFAAFEHRVTEVQVAADWAVEAATYVHELIAAGYAGRVALSRKAIAPSAVTEAMGLDARGVRTGTVYLGHRRSAEVCLKGYDKRHEREVRGFSDPGPMFRLEVTVKRPRKDSGGVSLHDVVFPGPLFWHYCSGLLPTPYGVPEWEAEGSRFLLEPQAERDYWRAVQRGVEGLADALRDLAVLSDSLGPHGRRSLLGLLAAAIGVALPSWWQDRASGVAA